MYYNGEIHDHLAAPGRLPRSAVTVTLGLERDIPSRISLPQGPCGGVSGLMLHWPPRTYSQMHCFQLFYHVQRFIVQL